MKLAQGRRKKAGVKKKYSYWCEGLVFPKMRLTLASISAQPASAAA